MKQHSFFCASHQNKSVATNKNAGILFLLLLALSLLPACTLATVRSLDEDEAAKEGFNPERYVDEIWNSQLVPTIQENAVEITALLTEIDADETAATEKYGHRSGTGSFSFMVSGEANVLSVNLESRIGLMAIDFAPYDGQPDANMAIGPVIRNRNDAVRDAVGFIQFNNFVNQTEFASVGSALKDRILTEVINPLDVETLQGKTIHFYGAFTLDNRSNIEIVPVILEVQG
jgi:predicted lipoprotein